MIFFYYLLTLYQHLQILFFYLKIFFSNTLHRVKTKNFLQILSQIGQKEEGINGITQSVFRKYLFPHFPELADRLFRYLHTSSKATTTHLGQTAFKQQAEKFLAILNDEKILENYVKMFSENKEETEVTPNGLRELLMVSYRLTIFGSGGGFCTQLLNTVQSVVTSCVSIIKVFEKNSDAELGSNTN